MTGEDGRFELVGCRKAPRYWMQDPHAEISVFADCRHVLRDPSGIEPLDLKILKKDLMEEVRITGRVTDQRTGKPVQGTVDYRPLAAISFSARLPRMMPTCTISAARRFDKDGTCRTPSHARSGLYRGSLPRCRL